MGDEGRGVGDPGCEGRGFRPRSEGADGGRREAYSGTRPVSSVGAEPVGPDVDHVIALCLQIALRHYRGDQALHVHAFGPGYRIYFGKDGGVLVILLGGGTKKGQQHDIAAAHARWKDYEQRKSQEE